MTNKPLSINKTDLLALKPCDPAQRAALFGRRKSLTAAQAFEAGATIRDVLWVLGKLGRKDLCIEFALQCAQRVAPLDKRGTAQPCIDATRAYVAEPTEENLAALRHRRAAAADDAADAAYAAAAAAAAADDAADAAYDAAYAYAAAAYAADAAYAYAAAAAAYAAYAAADAADAYAGARCREIEEQKKILIAITGGA